MSYAYHDINWELVFKRLLAYWLFPDWLNWILTSETFWNLVANETNLSPLTLIRWEKFSILKFKLTRNNNVPRHMWIPHPLAYAHLCKCLKENWDEIDESIWRDNENYANTSMVIPRDNDERRLVIIQKYRQPDDLDIETVETRLIDRWLKDVNANYNILTKQFGAKYIAYTDISWFFSNIYSHAIPWALVWKSTSKRDRDTAKWFNKIDYYSRLLKNDETNWIPIWPDTSHILSEIILSQIDKELSKYNFIRYIDDYHCYCSDREEAESFIKDVSQHLNSYQLELNEKKTFIEKLPKPLIDEWIRKIQSFEINEESETDTIIHFLDLATTLSNEKGDFSPFKFALKRMQNSISDRVDVNMLFLYISNITLLHPYLIESLDGIINKLVEITNNSDATLQKNIHDFLTALIIKHSIYWRSDVILWWFYIAKKYNVIFNDTDKIINETIKMNDSLATLGCFAYFRWINYWDLELFYWILENIDQSEWWIYIYELYKHNSVMFLEYISITDMVYKNFYNYLLSNNITFLTDTWNWELEIVDTPF